MPEFILDTSGVVTMCPPDQPAFAYLQFAALDTFTQAYIKALFFTENDPTVCKTAVTAQTKWDGGSIPGNAGFADLAPEALAQIIADCQGFQDQDHEHPWLDWCEDHGRMAEAGHDFWLTRNGHGAGFWDGDWPEPYAAQLDEAAKAFGQVDVYLGDDGKVYVQ